MVETVRFKGSQLRFELTGRRPVYRGREVVHTMALPGDPAPLAENLRLRARSPADVLALAGRMAA
jgi:hypothetical protein